MGKICKFLGSIVVFGVFGAVGGLLTAISANILYWIFIDRIIAYLINKEEKGGK